MHDSIYDRLLAGESQDEIMKSFAEELASAQKKVKAEKNKETEVVKRRKDLVTALTNYINLFLDKPLTVAEADQIEAVLVKAEAGIKELEKTAVSFEVDKSEGKRKISAEAASKSSEKVALKDKSKYLENFKDFNKLLDYAFTW